MTARRPEPQVQILEPYAVAMLIVVLSAAASACGGRDSSEVEANETGTGDGDLVSSEGGLTGMEAGDGSHFTGAILASVNFVSTDDGGSSSSTSGQFVVGAGFFNHAGEIKFFYPQATADAGCSCVLGVGTPGPEFVSAGTITISAAAGPVLAALMPMMPDPSRHSPVYGSSTSVIGWSPGDVLGVSAQGAPDQVKAFSTTLQTAAPFSAVIPALGGAPVTISRSVDFTVTWTPEARANEMVSLSISGPGGGAGECTCFGPESMGAITMPASFLAELMPSSVPDVTVSLGRSVVSTFSNETVTVYLIGEAAIYGTRCSSDSDPSRSEQ
jgi:hypothetical protein